MIPFQNVSLPAICCVREALALEVLAEDDVDQVEAEEADAPEPDHAREGEEHPDDRVPPPARVAEKLGQRAQLGLAGPGDLVLVRRGFPALGLLQPQEDRDRQQGGGEADQEHDPPRAVDLSPPPRAYPAPDWSHAASMLPTAESACSHPSANGRARSDMTSATSATPTANCPPTPSPVRKR